MTGSSFLPADSGKDDGAQRQLYLRWNALRKHQRTLPVAIIVEANTSGGEGLRRLDHLREESERIELLLIKAGYEVHALRTGLFSELKDLLNATDIRERTVVFHYCGHADGKIVRLRDDDGDEVDVYAENIARQIVGPTPALRLVYINACLSADQCRHYNAVFPEANFIGSRVEIPDRFALDFAVSFYTRWVGKGRGIGLERFRNAVSATTGSIADMHPEDVEHVMYLGLDEAMPALPDGVEALPPDTKFALKDGKSLLAAHLLKNRWYRDGRGLVRYGIAVFAIAAASLYLAHIYPRTSSPAFQAAFSYRPRADVKEAVIKRTSDRETPFTPIGNEVCEQGGHTAAHYAMGSPAFGFWVELSRIGLLLVLLWCLAVLVFNRMPKQYPRVGLLGSVRPGDAGLPDPETDRHTIRDWLFYPPHQVLLVVGAVGLALLLHYHLIVAPANLGGMDVTAITWMEARWPFFYCSETIWSVWNADGPPVAFADADAMPGAFWLYSMPYLAYMPYSITVFTLTSFPIMMVIQLGVSHAVDDVRLHAVALRMRLRREAALGRLDPEEAQRGFDDIRMYVNRLNGRMLATFSMITAFAAFETFIGRATVSALAYAFTLFAFAMMGVVLFRYLTVRRIFEQTCENLRDILNIEGLGGEEARQIGRQIGFADFPVTSRQILYAAVLIAMNIALVMLSTFEEGGTWTIFLLSNA